MKNLAKMQNNEPQEEFVILVDEHDNELGLMEKMEAHRKGVLHRAFSVFVFNDKGQFLLQQRAFSKYHSGGLWTNTCCSHPRKGESVLEAAHRRLNEEMGFSCALKEQFSFIYNRKLDNELTEHELDHVVFGTFNDAPILNPDEVADYTYIDKDTLIKEVQEHPEQYTEWFKICFDEVIKRLDLGNRS
jgi:isopentenyl-diphosphate Delta-isomerase